VLPFDSLACLCCHTGEAASFVHIEHGDDNQHHEPERGMEDITAKSAGSGVIGRPIGADPPAAAVHGLAAGLGPPSHVGSSSCGLVFLSPRPRWLHQLAIAHRNLPGSLLIQRQKERSTHKCVCLQQNH
jgi:hypothetical protein